MRFLSFAIVGAFAIGASAIPASSSRHVLHEKRDAVPRAWVKRDRLEAGAKLPVRIGMTQSNLDKGYDLLMEVSAHDSPKYGQHYTAAEVAEIFAPAQQSVDAVTDWLISSGISAERISQSVNKQWMQFDAAAHELEALLKTEYNVFEHTKSGKVTVACDEYHIPAHVQEHVDYITPGIKLFAPTRKSDTGLEKRTFGVTGKGKADLTGPLIKESPIKLGGESSFSTLAASPFPCDQVATPQCIATMYNITTGTLASANNQLGIFEDLGDKYATQDLNLFFSNFFTTIPQGTHPTLKAVDGATAPIANFLNAGAESDLDFQISYPIIWPQNSVLFQTDDDVYENNYVFEGFLNTFLDAIDGSYCSFVDPLDPPYPDPARNGFKGALECGLYTPTNVISISYGGQEFDLPASYQTRQCNEFMKLGLQGVSVVLASGDSGVAGPAGDDSANGCLSGGTVFSPDFPATCPFITTVGSTFLPTGANENIDAEIATTRFPSGGGFSNIYAIPDYQSAAVSGYLTNHPPPYASYSGLNNTATIGAGGGIFNSAGRAYPDVSAVGDNVLIVWTEEAVLIGGTSAAAPVWGAILTRINEERIAVGKSTVGFVNPVLYANPSAMHDITVGSNPGCGTNGFAVTDGWDPVTGLGTPNYPALLEVFMALP